MLDELLCPRLLAGSVTRKTGTVSGRGGAIPPWNNYPAAIISIEFNCKPLVCNDLDYFSGLFRDFFRGKCRKSGRLFNY